MCDVQCDEGNGDEAAVEEQISELSTVQSQQSQSQHSSAQVLSKPDQLSQALNDNVLSNTPPPVSKPTDRLVPLDLQPFVRYIAV